MRSRLVLVKVYDSAASNCQLHCRSGDKHSNQPGMVWARVHGSLGPICSMEGYVDRDHCAVIRFSPCGHADRVHGSMGHVCSKEGYVNRDHCSVIRFSPPGPVIG